ncbi:MAG: alpha/beta fold hydrolase [Planctomycetota bacterium]
MRLSDQVYVPGPVGGLATSVDLAEAPGADPTPQPTVLVTHGLSGNRLGRSYHLVEFARRLNQRGIHCVRFDQSGCGESAGEFVDHTVDRMVADLAAIRAWAEAQPWCDPEAIGLVGVSMGSLPAIASDAVKPVAAMALWAPVYDMPRVFGHTAKTGLKALFEHQGWAPYRGLRIGVGFAASLDAVDTPARLADGSCPITLFHAEDDEVVSVEESHALHARCVELGRPCDLRLTPVGGHDFVEYPDRQKLLTESIAFFCDEFK